MQAIGLFVFGVAFAMMVGLWTGLGLWRVLGFSLFGAFLIAGVVAMVTRGKARKR